MKYDYKILEEKEIYKGFFRINRYKVDIEFFDGTRSGELVRECIGKSGYSVSALPYDPKTREIVLIEQFRIGAMASGAFAWQEEIVAGFKAPNEDAEVAIQRELLEEIGTEAINLEKVAEFFMSPGGSGGRMILFFAEIDSSKIKKFSGLHEEGEDIRVFKLSYEDLLKKYQSGKIDNATALLATQAFIIRKNLLKN